ncbi:MAG: hypothetical protein U0K36_08135, partial [Bacteroidales bacterium]|nr:hypothetical protein [Bacteroidales bacterium]
MCGFTVYTGSDLATKLQFGHEAYAIKHRGPDNTLEQDLPRGWMAFHRLSIMDVSDAGNQPFVSGDIFLTCNGEIFNSPSLRNRYSDYDFRSGSDCECIIPLLLDKGLIEMARQLDGEFALVIYDRKQDRFLAARDPIGIRGMFYGYTPAGDICFASEMKALSRICKTVMPFPPGHVFDGEKFVRYTDVTATPAGFSSDDEEEVCRNINTLLT